MTSPVPISQRAQIHLEKLVPHPFPVPVGPYYDADAHPDGIINLSTAENTLLTEDIIPILQQVKIRSQHLKYRTALTRSSLPQLADLLPRYCNLSDPVRPVTRDNSVAGPGIGSLLANLVWTLCDEGDGVLLSTPYYSDYSRDIHYPARARTVLAHVPREVDPLSPDVIPILRARIISSQKEGVPVRCLMLCNPHNPIPRCHPLATIEGYIALAKEFGLHLIVDEVFANSVFRTDDATGSIPFISILSLPLWKEASSPLLQQIHILCGPTKDLGCSGLKAGLLVTENDSVRQSVNKALEATPISGATNAMLSELLGDEERLKLLLAKNRQLLHQAMDFCAAWASFHNLEYIEAHAGVYFILDLSPVAHNLELEGEGAIVEITRRMHANKVHINTTALDQDPKPYRFRFIFSHRQETLKLALRSLEIAFEFEESCPLLA